MIIYIHFIASHAFYNSITIINRAGITDFWIARVRKCNNNSTQK